MDDKVTITRKEYEDLQQDEYFLQCLRAAGVDNWVGYEYAVDEYLKEYPNE